MRRSIILFSTFFWMTSFNSVFGSSWEERNAWAHINIGSHDYSPIDPDYIYKISVRGAFSDDYDEGSLDYGSYGYGCDHSGYCYPNSTRSSAMSGQSFSSSIYRVDENTISVNGVMRPKGAYWYYFDKDDRLVWILPSKAAATQGAKPSLDTSGVSDILQAVAKVTKELVSASISERDNAAEAALDALVVRTSQTKNEVVTKLSPYLKAKTVFLAGERVEREDLDGDSTWVGGCYFRYAKGTDWGEPNPLFLNTYKRRQLDGKPGISASWVTWNDLKKTDRALAEMHKLYGHIYQVQPLSFEDGAIDSDKISFLFTQYLPNGNGGWFLSIHRIRGFTSSVDKKTYLIVERLAHPLNRSQYYRFDVKDGEDFEYCLLSKRVHHEETAEE